VVAVRPVGEEPIDLAGELGGLVDDLAAFGLRDYHVHSRTQSEWRCNWKLLMDTFLESYHVFALHRATLRDQPGHRMLHESFGHHMRIPVPFPTLYEQRDIAPDERRLVGHATIQHHLSPNVMLNHVGDYFVMWRFVPLAVDRTIALLTRYWPGPIDEELAARLDRRFTWQAKLTLEEDYPASERIHLALASGRLPETVLGRNEAAVIKFHTDLQQRLHDEA
jgi:phenylpropionate dioxygenase-like ring-hydroxylating dioxygenase large terminal subunit